ncbi:acetylcholinesterase [Hortaea werneckii]|nr:acetylcholinesterase [Hortaea werneckii]
MVSNQFESKATITCFKDTRTFGAQEDPYYANLTFLPPRTLDVGPELKVTTQTGTHIGAYNDTYPDVRQFLRVPFAQPPVGDLRWHSPQKLQIDPQKIVDSTRFGPNCAQYVPAGETFWNQYAPTNQVSSLGQRLDDDQVSWSSSEDCLNLAIWTPAYANSTSRLPVAVFVSGGGMVTGGIDIPSQLPTNWVSRSQEHIAVTINYRLNIFGNPMAKALNGTSFQLQDVRAAVEWVYENIEAFGGDPDNIFLWGQSAGASLTHLYTLAYPHLPLASHFGVISSNEDETVHAEILAESDVYDQFGTLSRALGCDYGNDYDAQINCMRQISWVQISEFINKFNFTAGVPYNFAYLPPDETYIFSNETDRYEKGLVASGPMIRSNAARERPSPNATYSREIEISDLCYTLSDAVRRYNAGLDTYKYIWAGNFSNISPTPWLGAFHWTDLLMIMGTYPTDRAPESTISELEIDTSKAMQDYMLAFTRSPNSLPSLGWPLFNPNATDGGLLLEFGNGTTVKNITGDYVFSACTYSNGTVRITG